MAANAHSQREPCMAAPPKSCRLYPLLETYGRGSRLPVSIRRGRRRGSRPWRTARLRGATAWLLLAALAPAQAPPARAKLIAVGDIMLSRGVAVRLRRYGPDYPLAGVAAYLRGADLVFGNLECTLQAGPPVPRRARRRRSPQPDSRCCRWPTITARTMDRRGCAPPSPRSTPPGSPMSAPARTGRRRGARW